MYWLDNDSGVTTPPAIPPVVSATRQYFTEGGGGDQPSIPGGEWFNMMTDEMLAVLAAAGITPDKANHTQLAAALAAMFPNKTTFAASLAANGYQKLPSGLIIQWGSVEFNFLAPPQTLAVTVTLPIAFPTAARSVVMTPVSSMPDSFRAGGAVIISPSQFTAYAFANAANTIQPHQWIAIGY